MRRTSWRALLTLAIAVVAMSAATVTSAAGERDRDKPRGHQGQGTGTATEVVTGIRPPARGQGADRGRLGRRGGDGRLPRHAGRHRHAAPGRQRRRRGGRGRRRARRDRAVLGRHRRRWLHGHPHAARAGDDDRQPREGAGRHAAGFVLRERRRRCRSTTPASAGCPPASPAPSPAGSTRSKRYGRTSLGKALQSGIEVARKGFVVDQTFFDQTHGERRLLQRRPVDGRDLPRPRRHPARRRHRAAQPGHGARVRDDRPLRRQRLLPRAGRLRDGQGGAEPADRRRRQPHVAPGSDDRAGPRRLHRSRARADEDQLQGPRRVGHGPAVQRRVDRR